MRSPRANVGRLTPRWTLNTAGAISATATVDEGMVYIPDYGGKLWAVAADGGKVRWSQDVSTYTGVAGDLSRTSPAAYRDDLILGDGWILSSGTNIYALDAATGKILWSFASGSPARRHRPWRNVELEVGQAHVVSRSTDQCRPLPVAAARRPPPGQHSQVGKILKTHQGTARPHPRRPHPPARRLLTAGPAKSARPTHRRESPCPSRTAVRSSCAARPSRPSPRSPRWPGAH